MTGTTLLAVAVILSLGAGIGAGVVGSAKDEKVIALAFGMWSIFSICALVLAYLAGAA
jgi:hypothetical protein